MKAAPFLLIIAILLGGLVIGFETITGSPDDSGQLAERPTVTPRPRPTSPSQLAQGGPTSVAQSGVAESGAAVPPVSAPQQPSAIATATAAAATTATPAPTATVAPPTPSPTVAQANAAVTEQLLKVGNTDGQGVFLRRTPQMSDKVRVWLDNTPLVVVGPPVAGDGHTWQHVRAPDGTEGYVPSEYAVGG